MMRSQTDLMLAARHDPEPYTVDGFRSNGHDKTQWAVGGYVLDPRAEMIPGRHVDGHGRYYPEPFVAENCPETVPVERPPVNPILVAFREQGGYRPTAESFLWHIGHRGESLYAPVTEATAEQREHACKVLTRLVDSASPSPPATARLSTDSTPTISH